MRLICPDWMQHQDGSSMPSGKEQVPSKTCFKDWTHIHIDQYNKPKNMRGPDMIHHY